ncbi:hypothetical protein [Asaia sp. HumB]|uniref:hypothetical protein n=1 Tax=Asaia sp. HumB TaxID=3035475 RepID=UPI002553C364|nr:hypothetical protein [Asaia sp. HumB]MDL2169784.1 hypothetical protein [Asaia sp. HumB]
MVDWMDRDLQRKLLVAMSGAYPDATQINLQDYPTHDARALSKNIKYLCDSGLCHVHAAETLRYMQVEDTWPVITNKGLDFLQDDGGLSAILNVVTVRFEADTLRALIAAKIDASSEPEEKKAEAKKRLLGLKEEGLKAAVGKVVEFGLGNIPTAASWFLSIT